MTCKVNISTQFYLELSDLFVFQSLLFLLRINGKLIIVFANVVEKQ